MHPYRSTLMWKRPISLICADRSVVLESDLRYVLCHSALFVLRRVFGRETADVNLATLMSTDKEPRGVMAADAVRKEL